MGNTKSITKKKELFSEIRFLVTSFKNKYDEYDKLPKYGLKEFYDKLQTDKVKIRDIEEFLNVLEFCIKDIEFCKSVDETVNHLLPLSCFHEYCIRDSYTRDCKDLKQKISNLLYV